MNNLGSCIISGIILKFTFTHFHLSGREWTGMGWTAVKDLHKLCPCSSCWVDPAVKIRIFFSNSNSPLNEYLCYRFRDSSFYFLPKSSKNLRRVHCQAIERDVPIRPKCPHKTVAKKYGIPELFKMKPSLLSPFFTQPHIKTKVVYCVRMEIAKVPQNWCMYTSSHQIAFKVHQTGVPGTSFH